MGTHPSWQMRRISAVNLQTFQQVSLQPPLPYQTWQICVPAFGTGRGKKPQSLPCSSCTGVACVPTSWHLLAAWNLTECKNIREACGHNKCTDAHLHMCAYTLWVLLRMKVLENKTKSRDPEMRSCLLLLCPTVGSSAGCKVRVKTFLWKDT